MVSDRTHHTQVLIEVMRRHQPRLDAIPGVWWVGVGFVYVDGERTEDIGIVLMVDERIPADQVDPRDLIPRKIEGCTVNVQVASPPVPA